MADESRNYWFPAKTIGWGWNLPVTWQGWLVVLVYFALVIATLNVAPTSYRLPLIAALTVVLVAIVVFKGEKRKRSA